jgi:hypothetical protein
MKTIACNASTRAKWLALSMVFGMALTTSAHAQFTPGSPFTPAQQVGTVLSMPVKAFGGFVAQNVIHQNNCNFLHFTQVGGNNIITASVRQRNTFAPAKTIWCPTPWVNTIEQLNSNDAEINQIGGDTNVAILDVNQKNKAAPFGTTWCAVPTWALGSVLQANSNSIYLTQLAFGDMASNVAVIGVTQNNKLKVPSSVVGAVVQINTNVVVLNQIAIGPGASNFAEIQVNQSNSIGG